MADPTAGNWRLRRLRLDLNRTQEEMVKDLNACAARLHAAGRISARITLTVRQYGKYERLAPPWPRSDTRIVFETFFRRPMSELGFTSPHGEDLASAGPPAVSTPQGPGPQGAASLPGIPSSRPVRGEAPPWLTPPASASGSSADFRIGEVEVELLRSSAEDMDALDQQFGANRLWRPTRAQLHWVHHMIDRGSYDDELGRQLHGVAGQMTASLAWFYYDAGLQTEARQYFSEAWNTANWTGDDRLASRTLSNMARQAVDLNKGREALRFARVAQTHAQEWAAPPRVMALLSIREAQAHACLSDTFNCEESIKRSWRQWERGLDDRDPDWTRFLNQAEMVCLEGMCRLDLGESARAQKLLARSEALQDVAHARNRGMCLGRLSVAALKNGDLHHSVAAATQSLRLIEGGMSSARAMQQLRVVHDGLAPHHRSREVGDLMERIHARVA
ncbi:hypothetical protein [Streptomyces sp. NPDC058280]|uniref:hypothetical protein n=1 Tax=Streptomyces sp. NPDC058280 TaxID=3346419 RepID=UPI0036F0CE02